MSLASDRGELAAEEDHNVPTQASRPDLREGVPNELHRQTNSRCPGLVAHPLANGACYQPMQRHSHPVLGECDDGPARQAPNHSASEMLVIEAGQEPRSRHAAVCEQGEGAEQHLTNRRPILSELLLEAVECCHERQGQCGPDEAWIRIVRRAFHRVVEGSQLPQCGAVLLERIAEQLDGRSCLRDCKGKVAQVHGHGLRPRSVRQTGSGQQDLNRLIGVEHADIDHRSEAESLRARDDDAHPGSSRYQSSEVLGILDVIQD